MTVSNFYMFWATFYLSADPKSLKITLKQTFHILNFSKVVLCWNFLQELVVNMTQTKINYMYPFEDIDRSKLFLHSSEIQKTWNSYGYGDDSFSRDDVVSVIYELVECPDFRNMACSGGQVINMLLL